jgi:protein gp37
MMQAARWSDLRGKERPGKPWLNGFPRMIFVGDMGDFLSKSVPEEYIYSEIFHAIFSKEGQRHFWMLLTKHPRRLAYLSIEIGGLPDNCMAMTTVTDQHTADLRLPYLLQVKCKYRGVSAEPLLGLVDFERYLFRSEYGCLDCSFRKQDENGKPQYHVCHDGVEVSTPRLKPAIDLIIPGGESGPHARPCDLAWIYSIVEQCRAAGVASFVKQLGAVPYDSFYQAGATDQRIYLKDKKGGDISEFPKGLQVREFPEVANVSR